MEKQGTMWVNWWAAGKQLLKEHGRSRGATVTLFDREGVETCCLSHASDMNLIAYLDNGDRIELEVRFDEPRTADKQ